MKVGLSTPSSAFLVFALVLFAASFGCSDSTTEAPADTNNDGFNIDECHSLDRDLIISDVGDFAALEAEDIDCVRGEIRIEDTDGDVVDLDPLHRIGYADGLKIGRSFDTCEYGDPDCEDPPRHVNENLSDLTGLRSLKTIGFLEIEAGGAFRTLNGLQGLERIDRQLLVHNLESSESFEGLENVRTIGGFIHLEDNPNLRTMSPLSGPRHVAGSFEIRQHPNLEDISALNDVERIDGDLILSGIGKVDDLSALSSLEHIGGELYLGNIGSMSQCELTEVVEQIGRDNIQGEIRTYADGSPDPGDC